MTAHPALDAWKGISSLPTAFDVEGELDLDGQRALARFAVESGADGVLCFGLAGEVFRLTPGERRTLLEVISEEIERTDTDPGWRRHRGDAHLSEARSRSGHGRR